MNWVNYSLAKVFMYNPVVLENMKGFVRYETMLRNKQYK